MIAQVGFICQEDPGGSAFQQTRLDPVSDILLFPYGESF